MTNEEAARILDPETSREALLPYAYDQQYQQMLLRDACRLAAKVLRGVSTTNLYIRDKDSGRIHRVGDECHDGLWVDTGGTVHYFNLQNGDGCSHHSRTDKNAGYEFMPSDFGELMVCQVTGED